MKFINYLESISGIGVYPLISLLIFFIFFLGVFVYVQKGSKEYFDTLSNIPLSSDEKNLNREKNED